ncbi:hypothetical protein CWI39_0918p0010 [Hamiltosporidium magnivora]|uniref:Uncharacterized protein n=1 Tax=Hamiltosporidium magnivora TaxID=148818 RepID=A0A4Q9L8L4_9MICR|nr:hypothetical protein CWI39_0918p0010 [Hamiltosporidium magnivora]
MPKEEVEIEFKDVIMWLSILCIICCIMYLHSYIRRLVKVNTNKNEGDNRKGIYSK